MPILYLVRGLPGSGKTYTAKKIALQYGIKHFEVDMFLNQEHGNFDQAFSYCKDYTEEEMLDKRDIIVANGFITLPSLFPYFKLAKKHNYLVHIKHPESSWTMDPSKCCDMCKDKIPMKVVVQMKKDFVTLKPQIYKALGLWNSDYD